MLLSSRGLGADFFFREEESVQHFCLEAVFYLPGIESAKQIGSALEFDRRQCLFAVVMKK